MKDDDHVEDRVPEPPSAWELAREWVDTPWIVLVVLFGATAALGLPLLWMSRGFRWSQKVFWTIVVVGYTLLLLGATWWICLRAWESIRSSLA